MTTVTVNLVTETCWCGITYSIPEALRNEARRSGTAVYCPLGHTWVFNDPEMKRLKRDLEQTRDARDRALRQRDQEVKAHSATKGQLTKARKAAERTRCPVGNCQRTFAPTGMKRHIASKHPDYKPDD